MNFRGKKGPARNAAHNAAGGFTLIELLVVVSIISLLSSIVLSSLNSARAKGRDAKRVEDIHQLQLAIELYYDANGVYPICATGGAVCTSTNYGGTWSTLQVAPTYMSAPPIDPSNAATTFGYYYARGYKNSPGNPTGSTSDYILATRLESSNPGIVTTFSGWDNGNLNYITGSR